MRFFRRWAAVLLCLSCLISSAGTALSLLTSPALAAWPYPEKEQQWVDYAQMTLEPYSDAPLQAAIAALEELDAIGRLNTSVPDKHVTVQALYDAILAEYDRMETQYYLWGIASDAHVHDAALSGGYLDWAEGLDRAVDDCWSALGLLSGTPYQDILANHLGDYSAAHLGEWAAQPAGDNSLSLREEALIRDYYAAMAQPFRVTWQGVDYTFDTLADAPLSDEDSLTVATLLEQAENEAVGPIFLDLVALRREMAAQSGYDSYPQYSYGSLYDRDYAPEDMDRFCRLAREYLVPLRDAILGLAGDEIDALSDLDAPTTAELLDRLGPLLCDMHPALAVAWNFMTDCHLYDLDHAPDKADTGYTVPLAQYGTAFIFNSPYGTWEDYTTLVHEFGHFVHAFYDPTPALWAGAGTDLGELQSQGLEILFTHYADDLFPGRTARGYTWATVLDLVDGILDGCMYDQFQRAVYDASQPLTLSQVNRLFRDISQEYGYTYESWEQEAFFWVETPHCFTQPLYHISYAVSALSALDLWLSAREDWAGAVESYLTLSAADLYTPYREAIRDAGLRDVFDPLLHRSLASQLEAALKKDYGRLRVMGGKKPTYDLERLAGDLSSVLLPLFLAIPLVVIAFRAVRRKRQKGGRTGHASPGQDPWENPSKNRKEDPWD